MKKRREKEYFTIEKELRDKFIKYIDDNNINKSKLIESLIEEYMNKIENNA